MYSQDTQIDPSNIQNLAKAFSFNTGHTIEALGVQSSPIFMEDKLIVNAIENISAINPENGNLIWQFNLGSLNEMNNPWAYFTVNRGIVFDELTSRVYRATNYGVLEIDGNSGELLHIYPDVDSSLAPIIHDNHLLIATADDGMVSFNLETKEKAWHTPFIKGGFRGRVWSGFSFDAEPGVLTGLRGCLLVELLLTPNSFNITAV
jgi:outer membrane protein assembly factor BamB